MAFDTLLSLSIAQIVGSVVLVVVTSYLTSSIGMAIYNLYFHPLAHFPGPASRAAFYFVDAWNEVKGSSARSTKLLHDKYGDVVRISPGALSFNTAEAWRDIYGMRQGKRQIPKDTSFFSEADACNIIIANDADHARIRRLFSHAFSEAALREQEPLLTGYFDLLIQKLKEQIDGSAAGKVDIMSWYNFTTFDIIGDLCLGESFNALQNGEYHFWIRNIFKGVRFLGIMRLARVYPAFGLVFEFMMTSIPWLAKFKNAHMSYTKERTEKRLDAKTDRKDFMTYVLRYNDERGLSREEITETSGVIMIGGSETTATLLSGATYHLLQTPEVLKKVQEEVRHAFSAEGDITLLSTAHLPYMKAVLEESLRIYPPVPSSLPRRTGPEGDTIDGKFIPPHTSIGVHQWATYHSSKNFADPETFAPERWLEKPPEKYRHDKKAALQPFSMGPRNCIGKNLAYFEMRSILARILWNFDMELCEESKDWMDQNVYLLWDKPPLYVKLSHRKNA